MSDLKVNLYTALQRMVDKSNEQFPGVVADHFVNCFFESEASTVGIYLLM